MRSARLSRVVAVATVGVVPAAALVVLAAPATAAPTAYAVTGTVAVGRAPSAVAVDPVTHAVYVADYADVTGGNAVSVLDGTTTTLTATVEVGTNPWGVAVDPSTRAVYVAEYADDSVSVINGATATVTRTIEVGSLPRAVAVDPSRHVVYVANAGGNSVSVVNGATNTVTTTVRVGANPSALAVDPSSGTVYVANASGNSVSVLNGATNTVTATIPVGASPRAVAVDPSTHTVYVGLAGSDALAVVNGQTVTATVPLGAGPSGVAVDPSTHTVYVTHASRNTVSVVDGVGHVVSTTVAVGAGPSGVAVDPSTHAVYIANTKADSVSVIGSAAPPTVTGVAPGSGLPSGGQRVTITGADLSRVSAVRFGAVAAASFTVDSSTQITAVTPAAGAGPVDVTVVTTFGTTAVSAADLYTYAKATPSITTAPSAPTAVGGAISDAVTLAGGASPSGTVTFTLHGPDDPTCTDGPLATRTAAVSGAVADSGPVTTTRPGTYRWTTAYAGDTDNEATSTGCGDATTVVAAPLDHLALTPATTTITLGGSQAFTAEGFDAQGNSLGDVTGATVFTVDGGGSCEAAVCTPGAVGTATVTGTDGAVVGTAAVTVIPPALDRVVVSPATATIVAGGSQTFTAEGFDAQGNSLGDVTGATVFTVDGGACTAAVCTASVAGEHPVTGAAGDASGAATLTVAAAALHRLAVTPSAPTFAAGASQTFTAEGLDAFGNSLGDVTGSTAFTIAGAGSCDAGACTSTVAGARTVTGAVDSVSGSTTVTVLPAVLDHLVLSPGTSGVAAGASQAFSAEGFDAFGNTLGDVTAAAVFAIDGGGSCSAAVCTAPTRSGGYAVTASSGPATGTAAVTVSAAALDHLVLSPATSEVVAGVAQAFSAEGVDVFGNSLGDVTGSTVFTLDGDGSCTTASCTSTVAGLHTVTGRSGTATGTATVTVTVAPPSRLVASSPTPTVVAGGSQSFTAVASDRFGNAADVTGATTFSITGGGTCAGALCTPPSKVGTYLVTATLAGLTATARLTVVAGPVSRLGISPTTATVAAGTSQTYAVGANDAYGNTRGKVTADATFTVSGGGSCAGAVCAPPTRVGTYLVTASYGGVSVTSKVTVVAGPVTRLGINPTTTTVVAGGSQTYAVGAYDAYGNARGKVTADTTFTVAGGGSCAAAVCTPPTKVGAYLVTATHGGASVTSTVTVVAGPLAWLAISPPSTKIVAGTTQTYVVVGYDAHGNSRGKVTGATTFTASAGASCTAAACGASAPGAYTVTAGLQGLVVTAALKVVAPASPTRASRAGW